MAAQLAMCKNDRCTNIVPPSKNPGVKKLYCTTRCGRRHAARLSYQREAGSVGDGMMLVDSNMKPQVSRKLPPNKKVAEARFKAHNEDCPLAARRGLPDRQCPAFFDAYDKRKLCLIHAVLNDDWWQLDAAEDGKTYERQTTTLDGHWISDVEQVRVTAGAALVEGSPDAVEKQIEAFVAAGGGVRPPELDTGLPETGSGL